LTANLVQQAIFQAVEAIKSGVERLEKNEDTSQPEFTEMQGEYPGVVRKSEISVMNVGQRPTNLRAGNAREQLTRDEVSRTT
jgi:hypothetical protein